MMLNQKLMCECRVVDFAKFRKLRSVKFHILNFELKVQNTAGGQIKWELDSQHAHPHYHRYIMLIQEKEVHSSLMPSGIASPI